MTSDMPAFPADSLAGRLLALLPQALVLRRSFPRGAAIFGQGKPAKAIYLVEAGRVRLARNLADGTQLVLHVAHPGESFAEAALSASRYHCDAVAEIESSVLALPKSELLSALAQDPARCLEVTLALAAQVRDLRARLELRNIKSADGRVLAWLRLHAAGDPPSVSIRRSWTQVADEIGLSREVVYRTLAALERERRIAREVDKVHLLSPAD